MDVLKKSNSNLEIDFITQNAIVYVLIGWVVILGIAKGLKLENRGFELKAYSLVYKNYQVQTTLRLLLGRTRRGIKIFADVSVVAGFLMMGFAFWFLIDNILKFIYVPSEAAQLTVLIPGVTLTSASAIAAFLLSLPIVLVVHEGAHGIVATLEKIKIKSGGFAIFIAVFAGFVEPDEEDFEKAKKISKLRVIGAGATANVIFSLGLGLILLTNPIFALVLPEQMVEVFYEVPQGVKVLEIMEGFGAQKAGIMVDDIITQIDDKKITSAADFQKINLAPGQTAEISVLRDGQEMTLPVEIRPSPEDPQRGLMGIIRDNAFFTPIYDFIQWDPHISIYLLWLWMISFFIGIINMLPLPILDGGKFIHSLISDKLSESRVNGVMWAIYAFTFAIFGLNIALTYIETGWFTI